MIKRLDRLRTEPSSLRRVAGSRFATIVRVALEVLLNDEFFDTYWRQGPIVFRNGIDDLLARRPSYEDFERWRASAEADPYRGVKSDGRTVFFLERLDDIDLNCLLEAARALFRWRDISCGSVRTIGPSSVGPHFDNSDNFVMQVDGEKEWFLAPSNRLPEDAWRRRMMVEPGFGALHSMPSDAQTFELEPGDILYLPLMWSHWGVSKGDSLSITLAVNAPSAVEVLCRSLTEALSGDANWWRPWPVPFTDADIEALGEQLARVDLEAMIRLLE